MQTKLTIVPFATHGSKYGTQSPRVRSYFEGDHEWDKQADVRAWNDRSNFCGYCCGCMFYRAETHPNHHTDSGGSHTATNSCAPTATPMLGTKAELHIGLSLEQHCADQWMWFNEAEKYSNVDTMSDAEWVRESQKIMDRGLKDQSECGTIWQRLENMPQETACYRDEVDEWMSEIEPELIVVNISIEVLGTMLNDAADSPPLIQDRNWRTNVFDQFNAIEELSDRLILVHIPSSVANAHYSIEEAVNAIDHRASAMRDAIADGDVERLSLLSNAAFTEVSQKLDASLATIRAYQLRCG